MDRLHALVIVAALGGCETKKQEEPASRVNGAKVQPKQAATVEAFCDAHEPEAKAPAFEWPKLVGAGAPGKAAGWRWVNVWATWCKPCVEEIPRLVAWRDKLAAAGTKLELVLVSVDEDEADVTAFRKAHPNVPATLRLADATKAMYPWFKTAGLTGEPPIPVHMFVAPSGKVRCARAASVREQDYAVVEKLFAE